MDKSSSGKRSRPAEDSGHPSSKDSGRSSSKDKQKPPSKDQESEKSPSKPSHSRFSKPDSEISLSSKSHQKSTSKAKDEKASSSLRGAEDAPRSSSGHRSSSKEDTKSSHTKHTPDDKKHSDPKSSHRSSKAKSDSSSKHSHRSSSKEEGKSSRRDHRSSPSDHKHSSKSAASESQAKSKHTDSSSSKEKDSSQLSSKKSSDSSHSSKSSRSHTSHKTSESKGGDESKSSKGHDHVKSQNNSKDRESSKYRLSIIDDTDPGKYSHRTSSKQDKSSSEKDKDKSRKEDKKSPSDSYRTSSKEKISSSGHSTSSHSKEQKSEEDSKKKHKSSKDYGSQRSSEHSKHGPSSVGTEIATSETKHDRDRNKTKKISETYVDTGKFPQQHDNFGAKSSTENKLPSFSKTVIPQSDTIAYSQEGAKSNSGSELQISRTGSSSMPQGSTKSSAIIANVESVRQSDKPSYPQEAQVYPADSNLKDAVKRTRSQSPTADENLKNYKRSKLNVPEQHIQQIKGAHDSAKEWSETSDDVTIISETGGKSDLHVSVKLSAIKRNVAGGNFHVEGIAHKVTSSNPRPMKKGVHFGGVQKFYIERRKKVRFSKVVATYKWPMSRKVKFVKLKKPSDDKKSIATKPARIKSKKAHKQAKAKVSKKQQKITGSKLKENIQAAPNLEPTSAQNKSGAQKEGVTLKSRNTKALTTSNLKINEPEKLMKSKKTETVLKPVSSDSTEKQKHLPSDKSTHMQKNVDPKDSKLKSKLKAEKVRRGHQTSKTNAENKSKDSVPRVDPGNTPKPALAKTKPTPLLKKRKNGTTKKLNIRQTGGNSKSTSNTKKANSKKNKSVILRIPKKLQMKRLKVAILKKLQKKSLYLVEIKRLTRIVRIERAIRGLTRSVTKLSKRKDISKIEKEIKRLIKIKRGLLQLNKAFDKRIGKYSVKSKLRKPVSAKSKGKNVSEKISSGAGSKAKSTSDKIVNAADKKSSKCVPAKITNKADVGKAKEAKKTQACTSKDVKKGGTASENVPKQNPVKLGKLSSTQKVPEKPKANVKPKITTSSQISTEKSSEILPVKSSTTVKKSKRKIILKPYRRSKKMSKEIKRCIRKLHENLYKAKNKSVTEKKKTRKPTRSERKIASKKTQVCNISNKIGQMKSVLKKHKDAKILGRKQLLTYVIDRKLRPFIVRDKSSRAANFKCLLMGKNYRKPTNLDCAHFRMIHDTQNVCVVNSPWGKMPLKSDDKKPISVRSKKPIKRLKSGYIECFQNAKDAKITTINTVSKTAKPYHLALENNFRFATKRCTIVTARRQNGFGYFYCPNPTTTKIVRRVRALGNLKKMSLLLVRRNVQTSRQKHKTSKASVQNSHRFPLEKLKLPPGQESLLGVIKKVQNSQKGDKKVGGQLSVCKSSAGISKSKVKQQVCTQHKKSEKQSAEKIPPTPLKSKKSTQRKSVLLKKTVMPSKRRVLCQKSVVYKQKPSHSPKNSKSLCTASMISSSIKGIKSEGHCATLNYQYFIRKGSAPPGWRPKYFLFNRPCVSPTKLLAVRRKTILGYRRMFLVRKYRQKPRLTLLKPRSPYLKAKLVLSKIAGRRNMNKSDTRTGFITKTQERKSPQRSTESKKNVRMLIKKKIVSGKPPRVLIRKKPVARDILRKKEVLLQQKKPRILIQKRRMPGGRIRLVIRRESIPGKKGKILRGKIYKAGLHPRIIVQKVVGQKPKIILVTHNQALHSKQIECRLLERKSPGTKRCPIVRKELSSGKVFQTICKADRSTNKQESTPMLLMEKNNTRKPQFILKHESSLQEKIQYFINRESVLGQKIRFMVQQGNLSKVIVIKKLVPGRQPQIIMKKILVSEVKSESSQLGNLVRKTIGSQPPPLLIMEQSSTPGQLPRVLVRRECIGTQNPLVKIEMSKFPGQKPRIVIKTSHQHKPKYCPTFIKNAFYRSPKRIKRSRKRREQLRRIIKLYHNWMSTFLPRKSFFRKPKCLTKVPTKGRQVKIVAIKPYKIYAARSRVVIRNQFSHNRTGLTVIKRTLKKKLNKQKHSSKHANLRNAQLRELKLTKYGNVSRSKIPGITVQNIGGKGKKPTLLLNRKLVAGKNLSVCVVIKQMGNGNKPKITIRRNQPSSTSIRGRFPILIDQRKKEELSHHSLTSQGKALISGQKLFSVRHPPVASSSPKKPAVPANQAGQPLRMGTFPNQKLLTQQSIGANAKPITSVPDKKSPSLMKPSLSGQDNIQNSNAKSPVKLLAGHKLSESPKKGEIKLPPPLQQRANQGGFLVKRKYSPTSTSPNDTNKLATKKRRVGLHPSGTGKPVKRINNSKQKAKTGDTKNHKSKAKRRKLCRKFPNLLSIISHQVAAEYFKSVSKEEESTDGKSGTKKTFFKVPKVPPPRRGSLTNVIESKESNSDTYIAPNVNVVSQNDSEVSNDPTLQIPNVVVLSEKNLIASGLQTRRERPNILGQIKTSDQVVNEARRAQIENLESSIGMSRNLASGLVHPGNFNFANESSPTSDSNFFSNPLVDPRCFTETEKNLIAAGIQTGFPSASKYSNRPKSPSEPIPAIWAVPPVPRFKKTTVTSLLEKIARKTAGMQRFIPIDSSDDECKPIFNTELDKDDDNLDIKSIESDASKRVEREVDNSLLEKHPISKILKGKRFAEKPPSKLLGRKTSQPSEEFKTASRVMTQPKPHLSQMVRKDVQKPIISSVVEPPTRQQQSFFSQGRAMNLSVPSPDSIEVDSFNNIFMTGMPMQKLKPTGVVFQKQATFNLGETDSDFFNEPTGNVAIQFEKLISTLARKQSPKEPKDEILSVNLPATLVHHEMSTFQKSVHRFKQNQLIRIATFARKRAQRWALRNRAVLRKARKLLLKAKSKIQAIKKAKAKKPNIIKNKGKSSAKRTPGTTAAKNVQKLQSTSSKGTTKKSSKTIPKTATLTKAKKASRLKSILKKPSFGMKTRRKVAPMRALPKDFVLKSILKKKKMYPSHPGAARESSSSDPKIAEPLKTTKKKIVISSIISPVPVHTDRTHNRCKHFKGLKITKSKCAVPSEHKRPSGRGHHSEQSSSSSSRQSKSGTSKSTSASSEAGCSKDMISRMPTVQATSTVFKVPAIPPTSSKIRGNASSSTSPSSSISSSPVPKSSTYIAPQVPPSSPLSLSGILSDSFKVPATPPSSEKHSSSRSSSSKRHRQHTPPSHSHSSSKRRKQLQSPHIHKDSATPHSSEKATTELSPGGQSGSYSGLTLSALLKSSDFPATKGPTGFKPLKLDWASSVPNPTGTHREHKIKSLSQEKAPPQPKSQATAPEVQRTMSVPTKAQLKQVPQHTPDANSKKSSGQTRNPTTKTSSNKAIKQKNQIPKPTKSSPSLTAGKKGRSTKLQDNTKKGPLKKTPLIKLNLKVGKPTKPKAPKPAKNEVKSATKKTEKASLRKCKHSPNKSKKISKTATKTSTGGGIMKKSKKNKKSKSKAKKSTAKKVTFAKPKSKTAKRKTKKKPAGPRFNVRYSRETFSSVSKTRLRVLTSLYYKYEKQMLEINKVRKQQRVNRKVASQQMVCPNFLQEVEYMQKVQRNKKFNSKLGLAKQKHFEGTRKIQMKSVQSKRLGSLNSSQSLAQKVIMKYGSLHFRKTSAKGINKIITKKTEFFKANRILTKHSSSTKITKRNLERQSKEKKLNLKKATKKSISDDKVRKEKINKQRKQSGIATRPKQPHDKLAKVKAAKIRNDKVNKITLRKKSLTILKKPKKSIARRNLAKKLRLLKNRNKLITIPDEKRMPLTTMFVPKRHGTNPETEAAKPFIIVPAKKLEKLTQLGKVIHSAENAGLVNDWLAFMVTSFKKQPPKSEIRKTQLVSRVPSNCYIMHAIELQKHKRELQDRITDLKEKGLATKIGPMPKLPPVPKGFVEEETTPLDKASAENAITQRLCLSIAHGGFTHSKVAAVEALSWAVQQFYKNFCHNLKETVHRNNSHHSIGFPDPMDRVLTDKGFGGVRGLEDYYNTEILQRHKSLQNMAALKRVEYASILRANINVAPHIPITPEDFAPVTDDDLNLKSPVDIITMDPKKTLSESNISLNKSPGDKGILNLVYELETDVLKSSQTVLSHEVIRPRFLEYQEVVDSPQSRLEIACVPITASSPGKAVKCHDESQTEETFDKTQKESVGIAVETNRTVISNQSTSQVPVQQGTQNSQTNQANALSVLRSINTASILPTIEQSLLSQWQKMVDRNARKPPVCIAGKWIKPNVHSAEQSLLTTAAGLKARLAFILRDPTMDQVAKDDIIKNLDPRILHFLKMAEVARKYVEIRARALQASFRASQTLTSAAQPNATSATASSSSASATASMPSLLNRNNQVPLTGMKPLSKAENTISTKMASSNEFYARNQNLTHSSYSSPSTSLASNAKGKEMGQLKSTLSNSGKFSMQNIKQPKPQQNSTSGEQDATKSKGSSKQNSQSKTLSKDRKAKTLSLRMKAGQQLGKEFKKSQLFLRISNFIQRLPKQTRVTALLRNPNLVKVLGYQANLAKLLKKNSRLGKAIKSAPVRKTVFDAKTKSAKRITLPRSKVQVFDKKAKNAKIVHLKGNQWKTKSKRHAKNSEKVTTLARNQGVCKNPLTNKRKIVTVERERVQIINIRRDRMKIVYPNSNKERIVFVNQGQVETTSKTKTKTTRLTSNQLRITDAAGSHCSTISLKRSLALRRNDTVHRAPSNKVTVFDPKTRQLKSITLTAQQVAIIDPKTRKVKIRKLKRNQVKILDPITKAVQIITLKPDQIYTVDQSGKTVRITNLKQNQVKVLDPVTKKMKILTLKPNQVKVVNPITKKVNIVNIEKLKSVHSHSNNLKIDKRVFSGDVIKRSSKGSLKGAITDTTKLTGPKVTFLTSSNTNSDAISVAKFQKSSGTTIPLSLHRESLSSSTKSTPQTNLHVPPAKADVKKGATEKQQKVGRIRSSSGQFSSSQVIPTFPMGVMEQSSGHLLANKPNVPGAHKGAVASSMETKTEYTIRKSLAGESVCPPPIKILPTTSLLRPVNPNLPQFTKTSIIQIGSSSNPVGPSSVQKIKIESIPTNQKMPQGKQDIGSLNPMLSKHFQPIIPGSKSQQSKSGGTGSPGLYPFQAQQLKSGLHPHDALFNLKAGMGANLPITSLHPIAASSTSRVPQSSPSASSTTTSSSASQQHFKVAYRVPQIKMAPVIPHSSMNIRPGGEHSIIFDPTHQSGLSPSKVAFSSPSLLSRPIQATSSSESGLYNLSPTRKSDKGPDKSSSSSQKTSSRHSDSSSSSKDKSSKSSKSSSSRTSDSKSSSRSSKEKEKDKSSSRSSDSKSSGSSSSKSSGKHHASKHSSSSSSSKSHRDPSPVPKKSKHHKSGDPPSPETKQPVKRGRPPKRSAPASTSAPKKPGKDSSRHSTPDSADESLSSRKHAKYH